MTTYSAADGKAKLADLRLQAHRGEVVKILPQGHNEAVQLVPVAHDHHWKPKGAKTLTLVPDVAGEETAPAFTLRAAGIDFEELWQEYGRWCNRPSAKKLSRNRMRAFAASTGATHEELKTAMVDYLGSVNAQYRCAFEVWISRKAEDCLERVRAAPAAAEQAAAKDARYRAEELHESIATWERLLKDWTGRDRDLGEKALARERAELAELVAAERGPS